MKLIPTKNYKKLYKTLKKSTASSIPITIEMKNTNYYDCLHCEHVEITNDSVISTTTVGLPNDIVNYILEFIPINTRLSILKSNYNTKILKNKLENINVEKLYKCALLADEINNTTYSHYYSPISHLSLYRILAIRNELSRIFSVESIEKLSKEEINKYPYYYKKEFIKMIIFAIKHHRKIYKRIVRVPKLTYRMVIIGTDHHGMDIYMFRSYFVDNFIEVEKYKDILNFEKMLFKMYSHMVLI
jgi:hypothetical protein